MARASGAPADADPCRAFSLNGRSSPGFSRSSSCSVGSGRFSRLPIAQYPDVAPTADQHPRELSRRIGGTLESSVTQSIEQTLTGLDGLLYFSASSSSRGQVSISAVFDKGSIRTSRRSRFRTRSRRRSPGCRRQVQQQGVTVTKGSPDFLMIVGVYDQTDKSTNVDVSDWLALEHPGRSLAHSGCRRRERFRLAICDAHLARSEQAPKLSADAERHHHRDSEPECRCCRRRDRWNAAAAGADARCDGDGSIAPANARAVPQHHRQVRSLRRARATIAMSPGSSLGGQLFGASSESTAIRRRHRHFSRSGRQCVEHVEARQGIHGRVSARACPPAITLLTRTTARDFIKLSVIEVVKTLAEAMVLVILVMFVFLQSWRATLDSRDRDSGRAARHVRDALHPRLFDQHADLVRARARGRLARRRCHRRRRERRTHPRGAAGAFRQGSDDPFDAADPDGADRHCAGPLGGFPADDFLRRIDRRHLPPIFRDHRLGDGACRCFSR